MWSLAAAVYGFVATFALARSPLTAFTRQCLVRARASADLLSGLTVAVDDSARQDIMTRAGAGFLGASLSLGVITLAVLAICLVPLVALDLSRLQLSRYFVALGLGSVGYLLVARRQWRR